ncbi:hypothetical protein KOR42_03060 [Thalassoglobus neptunius]|uniref:Uncharacterized protein n=1 Tax=Thalassoglobus neptunius TaxID=1938619 RepID=A0A5C5X296_9PLAN|nr:hypothetical protein KOR42_03060 [Thalassoglobus neptunius]
MVTRSVVLLLIGSIASLIWMGIGRVGELCAGSDHVKQDAKHLPLTHLWVRIAFESPAICCDCINRIGAKSINGHAGCG